MVGPAALGTRRQERPVRRRQEQQVEPARQAGLVRQASAVLVAVGLVAQEAAGRLGAEVPQEAEAF